MSFNAYAYDEVVDASQRLDEALTVAHLLKTLGDERPDIDHGDLGSLFIRLIDPPLTIICELLSHLEPRDHDPDPGKHEPVLVSISEKCAAEG